MKSSSIGNKQKKPMNYSIPDIKSWLSLNSKNKKSGSYA